MSGSFGLLSLLASSHQNEAFGTNNGYMYHEESFDCIGSSQWNMEVQRYGDTCVPIAIKYTSNQPVDLSTLTLTVTVGGQDIISVPLSLLKEMGTLTEYPYGETVIKFDFRTFLNSFPMIRLTYHVVRFTLRSETYILSRDITHASLTFVYQFLATEARRAFIQDSNPIAKPLQTVAKVPITVEGRGSETKIGGLGLCKGFLIEGDIDSVENFEVKICNQIQEFPVYLGEKIGTRFIFLGFNYFANFRDNDFSRFEGYIDGTANVVQDSGVVIKMQFRTENPNIKLHVLNINSFRSQQGMGGVLFHPTQPRLWNSAETPYVGKFDTSNQWSTEVEYRPIVDSEKLLCPIKHENIEIDEKYAECTCCFNNFNYVALTDYFRSVTVKKCPMCRETWSNYTVYENGLGSLEGEEVSSPVDVGENLVSNVE